MGFDVASSEGMEVPTPLHNFQFQWKNQGSNIPHNPILIVEKNSWLCFEKSEQSGKTKLGMHDVQCCEWKNNMIPRKSPKPSCPTNRIFIGELLSKFWRTLQQEKISFRPGWPES